MFWGKIRNGLAQTKSKSGAYQSTARRRIAQKRPRVRPSPIRVAILRYQASVSSEILSRIARVKPPQAFWKKGWR